MHMLQEHIHNPSPVAGLALGSAEFVKAVAEEVVAVLLFLTAVGPGVHKINPIMY